MSDPLESSPAGARSPRDSPGHPIAESAADAALAAAFPELWAALSPLGLRLRMPPNFLPQQTAEARGKRFNATIGQITDGHGRAVPLPAVAAALGGLPEEARSRALLYSPVEGLADLRERWRQRQRRGQPASRPSSLPLATGGTVHALSLAAQLFAVPGRAIFISAPPPAGFEETLGLRTGARLLPIEGLAAGGRLDPRPLAAALAGLDPGEPVLVALRLPAVQGGPYPDTGEREALASVLLEAADRHPRRPIVVLVDDLWERFDTAEGDGEPASRSLFWELTGRHPALLPLKADGAEGELDYAGGRIGFLTLPFAPGTAAAGELESKVKLLLRAEIGSPSAASQVVLLAGLDASG